MGRNRGVCIVSTARPRPPKLPGTLPGIMLAATTIIGQYETSGVGGGLAR